MMNREETDLNKNADTTCLIRQNVGSSDLGSYGNNSPLRVKAEMDDIKPEFWRECVTCGKIFTNRDDGDFHATSCQIIEDDVMSTSKVARSDSRFILNTNKECDKSTSGTAENPVEMSVVHNLSTEFSKVTTDNVTPSHVPYETSYEIENVDGKVLGVVVDDKEVAEGIPLPPKENASSSTEESKFLEIKLSKKLSWIPCQYCGIFVPNQANLEYHIACRHYSPKIFDDTFDDRDQAGKEKGAEGSDVQFVMPEESFIEPDVRMTRWFQCETCHEFVLSEDDLLRHLCPSNLKRQGDSRSRLEETDEDEDWIGASNFGVGKDELIRETEKDADQILIKDILNDPHDLDLDKGEIYAERSDPQLPILSKSRPGQTTQKSEKTNANCFNGKTRGRRGISDVQKETSDSISRKNERLLKRLGREPEIGQISIGLVEQESESENMQPSSSSFNLKSRGKQVLMSKQNEGNSYSNEKDDPDVVEKRSSSHCKQIRESRRERKLLSASSTSINLKSRESRTRKSEKGVNALSSKNGNQMYSPGSRETRPNAKYKHQCTECFKCFQLKCNLRSHMRSHTGEKPFECAICFRKFARKQNLKRHQIVHDSNNKPFECEICRRRFLHKDYLKKHRELHNRVLPLKCQFCPMRFGHQSRLIPHERLHMGPRPFKCDQCSATFTKKENWQRHQFLHTGERPFKCKICNRKFKLKYNLRSHETIHSDQLPFKCNSCPKKCRTKYDLRRHELTHLTERPFKCDLCPRSFIRKGELADHKYVHTGERPHKCDVCSKRFRVKSDLTGHKKLHSASTQFKCDVGSKTFKVEKYLRLHKNTHSSANPYKCDNCENIFKTASALRYHRKKRCVGHGKVNFEEPISSTN